MGVAYRNFLAYPGSRATPGIVSGHFALHGGDISLIRFSGVATPGGSFQRLDRADVGTYTAGVRGAINGGVGPIVTTVASAGSDSLSFTHVSTPAAVLGATFAVVAAASTINGGMFLCVTAGGFLSTTGIMDNNLNIYFYQTGNNGGQFGSTGNYADGDRFSW